MKTTNIYQAVLFHPSGDMVTDFRGNEFIEDVNELINYMVSKWIFYPIAFVATEKTIVSTPDGLEWMKGRRIKTIKNFLSSTWANNAEEICDVINNGLPLELVY